MPATSPRRSEDRAQASVLGVVLLLALVIGGSTAVVALSAGFFQETESRISVAQSEKVLKLVDSRAALVALGGPSTDTVRLSDGGSGEYRLDGSAGWMNITATDRLGTTTRVMNLTLGKVEYETEAATVAYQGGGVWKNIDGGGLMVSPPEFKYRNGTLTLPMINVTGQGTVSGKVTIEAVGTRQVFPSPGSSALRNPLEDQRLNVTVKSEFYRAWGQYFEQRTSSEVRYVPSRDLVHVTLVPPPQPITFDSAVTASGNLSIKSGASGVDGNITLGGTTNDESKVTGTTRENVAAVSKLTPAAAKISDARARLQNESAPGNFSTVTAGRYFVSDDTIFDTQTTFDTTNGDIVIFVDGNVDAGPGSKGGGKGKGKGKGKKGGKGTKPAVEIVGDGTVRVYVNGTYDMKGQAVWGSQNETDSLVTYSRDIDRFTKYYGAIYTGAVDVAGGGKYSPNVKGAVVSTADDVEMTGNSNITYDDALEDRVIESVETEFAEISYLHISANTVKIAD
jgi:hypothetical protein